MQMTPAIESAKQKRIDFAIHEYKHNPKAASYGLEAAEALSLAPQVVFKTLVVSLSSKGLAVAILPVNSQLNMKHMAKALGDKKASMAEPNEVARSTGYVLGGVSSLGQKKALPTVIDASAMRHVTIYVSAGRRGLELALSPADLVSCTRAKIAAIT
jgi:Cys-tRNA(Pro)/Cys-tRNA(Cys) deacylase